jgi:signal transduction histidine kinase
VYDKEFFNFYFLSYITFFWLLSAYYLGFYKVYRHTNFLHLFTLLARQFFIFTLGYFAYFGLFREGEVVNNQFLIFSLIVLLISLLKFINFYLLTIRAVSGQMKGKRQRKPKIRQTPNVANIKPKRVGRPEIKAVRETRWGHKVAKERGASN